MDKIDTAGAGGGPATGGKIEASETIISAQFVSGIGQFHTHEPDPQNPSKILTPYLAIAWGAIQAMVDAPPPRPRQNPKRNPPALKSTASPKPISKSMPAPAKRMNRPPPDYPKNANAIEL